MISEILIIAIVIVVVLAGAALLVPPFLRRKRLRDRFGPEYDRTLEHTEGRRAAERELLQRERRHDSLELRELTPERKNEFTADWASVQERFVDEPADAVREADRLVTTVMAERGYPTEGFDQQVADLSVGHAATLGHYRDAHDIAVKQADGRASTEDLRTAIVHYRALFLELTNGHTVHTKDTVS
ncbi:hypothetical protein ACFWUP_02880 [Nocardia sp. NPDC058658]|uniref:hypothetical protein n=1 Tax=Nocardia sp. NPDC058658 TaxID=3346580 RepID=UPI00364B0E00